MMVRLNIIGHPSAGTSHDGTMVLIMSTGKMLASGQNDCRVRQSRDVSEVFMAAPLSC